MATKSPFGKSVKKDPFQTGNNPSWVPGDDSFEDNAHQHPWRPGYRQAEDGSWVPGDYWSGSRSPMYNGGGIPDDDSFEGNSAHDPNRGRPGYVQAEDGSWVPADYWDKAKGKRSVNTVTGKPIEW